MVLLFFRKLNKIVSFNCKGEIVSLLERKQDFENNS